MYIISVSEIWFQFKWFPQWRWC